MLLKRKNPFKLRHILRRFDRLIAFSVVGVILVTGSMLFGGKLKTIVGDWFYDAGVLTLAIIEQPISDYTQLKENFNRHIYIQKNAKELDTLLSQLRSYKNKIGILEFENQELKEALSLAKNDAPDTVTAQCFGQNSILGSRSIFARSGKQNGISRYDIAYSENAIIGQIDEVGEQASRVLLITDANSRVPIFCNQSKQEGIATGYDDNTITIMFMNKPNAVKIGELVVTSGIDGHFPRGKIIGIISKIENDIVFVTPEFDKNQLRYIQIQKAILLTDDGQH